MLIAMAGLPGTGKSTLARGLAQRLPAVVLDKDPIRAALFASSGIEHSTRQDDFCMQIMLQVAEYLWHDEPRRPVILDGRPFTRRSQRAAVAAFAASCAQPFRLIECVCSDETARWRLQRDAAMGNHPAQNRDYDLYQQIKARFEPIEEAHLVVDTDDDYQTCLARSLAYLQQT